MTALVNYSDLPAKPESGRSDALTDKIRKAHLEDIDKSVKSNRKLFPRNNLYVQILIKPFMTNYTRRSSYFGF